MGEPIITWSDRRRVKAALVMVVVWTIVAILHVLPVTRWAVTGLAASMVMYVGRLVTVSVPNPLPPFPSVTEPKPVISLEPAAPVESYPFVSILIPAKNEEAVLPSLLGSLAAIDYPPQRHEVWVIDDGSTDQTADILADWQPKLPYLKVHYRPPTAPKGKSAVLNEVLPHSHGEIIGVFDADATVPPDLLRRSLPTFHDPQVVAVQIRKTIANRTENIWTWGQATEMALDSYVQQQRIEMGGIGELRGNGQLVRRQALQAVGGWNEATITDDLDLSFRLHLAGGIIAFFPNPAVAEEGVTTWSALWHQRNRWAEGGYQRYLDYWPSLVSQLSWRKKLDMSLFGLMQYVLPMALVPDFLWTTFYSHQPALWPLGVAFWLTSGVMLLGGLRRTHHCRQAALLPTAALSLLYLLHWVPVMIATTARLCVRPKQLKWVKTLHVGSPPPVA